MHIFLAHYCCCPKAKCSKNHLVPGFLLPHLFWPSIAIYGTLSVPCLWRPLCG
jgi:hypothetical protein